jgi:CheY-like chemotaxis protein
VAKTLLAVDDSATMRKALEITFSGEDFTVVTADSQDAAMGKLGDNPSVVLIDTTLGGGDGYAVSREVRARLPKAAIILLSSRYNPYDPSKGGDSGADDFCDKPFDTQALIDKTKKALATREAGGGAVAAAPAAAAPVAAEAPKPAAPRPAAPAPVAAAAPPAPAPMAPAAPPPAAPAASAANPPSGKSRAATLVFGGGAAPAAPAAAPAAAAPINAPAPARQQAPSPAAPSPAAQAVQAGMANKLGELGLTAEQAEAVLALSREVVERVVWEVVPQLAETIIREEIARLTKE